MRQYQWSNSHVRLAHSQCGSVNAESLVPGRWASIPASQPIEPDPPKPTVPPRTPDFPPNKERPEIDDPPPDVVPVPGPVREPPSSPIPVALSQ